MTKHPITVTEYSKRLDAFWQEECRLLERRIADPEIRASALSILANEQKRGVAIYYQTPLERALEMVAGPTERTRSEARYLALSEQGRKGGRAKKQDKLQDFIDELVAKRPRLSERDLLNLLKADAPTELWVDIDEEGIHFAPCEGTLKTAPLSGLKDRLSRAKKKVLARTNR